MPFKSSPCVEGQGGTIVLPTPRDSLKAYWPQNCTEIDGAHIATATTDGEVGFMLLNGKRLGNLGAMEAMPNGAILFIQQNQMSTLGTATVGGVTVPIYGQILWTAGTRGGVGRAGVVPSVDQKLKCTTQTSLDFCWIGRFGWLGDRVSLEDQVANAAFIEMNMTTPQGYQTLYGSTSAPFPVRYNLPNCGPADQELCQLEGQQRQRAAARNRYQSDGRLCTLARRSDPLRVYGCSAGGNCGRKNIQATELQSVSRDR